MTEQKKKVIFWTAFLGLVVLFLLVKALSPGVVEGLYRNGNFAILNRLTGGNATQPLGFYLGRMEEAFFGPISMVVSGLAFLMFCFVYLKNASGKIFGLAVFLYLLVTKFDILFFPPYGDTITAPFAEAIWLARHAFDYIGLANQPGFVQGGPKVYLLSIYPTYLAILIKLIPNVKLSLLVNHLIVFVWAAVIISFFRSLLLRLFDEEKALLVSLMLLSLPLFQSQVEALNMEIPTLLFSVISIYYLAAKNIRLASIMSMMAVMIKGYAVLICATVFIVGVFLFFWEKELKLKREALLWGFLAILFAAAEFYASFLAFHAQGKVKFVGLLEGWRWIKITPVTYFYLASLLIFITHFIKQRSSKAKVPRNTFFSFLKQHYIASIMFTCAGAWFAIFLNSYADAHRYRLLLTPFSVFCVFFAFQLLVKSKKIIRWSLITAITLSFLCSYGLGYKPSDGILESVLERSLEYRNDLKLHIRIAKDIEDNFSNFTISAPFTMAHSLAIPELGYVKKSLDVVLYGYPCTYGNIKNFKGLTYLNILKTMWVGLKEPKAFFEYPVGPKDKVVKEIYVGNRKGTLFLGGAAVEKMRLTLLELSKRRQLRTVYNPKLITITP